MRLATNLPVASSVMPDLDERELHEVGRDWFEAAGRVERAHRLAVAWFRSRLPGYPNLPAPQLAPGTPLTTLEFTYRLIWTAGERSQRLQFRNPPADIAEALHAEERQRLAIDETTRKVAAALSQTPEWRRLADADGALDVPSRDTLRLVGTRIRDRLSPGNLDAYEPRLALRRGEYRAAVVAEEVAGLSGVPGEYAAAFTSANNLVEHAASDVFGQLASYPLSSLVPHTLELQPGDPTVARFSVADEWPWPEPGMLAWLADPLVVDAVMVTGVNIHWENTGHATLEVTATVIRHTANAWRGNAPPS